MHKKIAYGFDQGASRDVGVLFIEETSKTLSNGSCHGHHNGVVICYTIDEKMGNTYIHEEQANTLAQRDYKQPQAVIYDVSENNRSTDGELPSRELLRTGRIQRHVCDGE